MFLVSQLKLGPRYNEPELGSYHLRRIEGSFEDLSGVVTEEYI